MRFLQACGSGNVERVKQLLGKGVDINTQNRVVFDEHVFEFNFLQYGTALHPACSGGHVEVVTLLLAGGAQVNVQDWVSCVFDSCDLSSQRGYTALHLACSGGHVELGILLLSAGASIGVQTEVRSGRRINKSCFHFICVQDGKTPLHLACARGAVGLVSELLAAGVQIEARDKVNKLESACL
jgi:ankyrin repeat protein